MGEELRELFSDLDRQLACRAEHKSLGDPARRINLLDDRDAECRSLPCSGLGLGSHIAAVLNEWDGECLDWGRLFKPHIFYCFSDLTRKPEIGELYSGIHIAPLFGVGVLKMAPRAIATGMQ